MENTKISEDIIAPFFIIIPTILVIFGLLFFSYPIKSEIKTLLAIPLFLGLILLGLGFLLKKGEITNKVKIVGWWLFAFYWSTLSNTLYFGEDGDIVNVSICIVGVFVFFYFAYHEWLSMRRKDQVECLNWAAGAAAIAGIIYFVVELTPLAPWLIETVAAQSGWILNLFVGNIEVIGISIVYNGITVVNIIFACTALQSMVLFVGMILPLKNVNAKRKFYGLLVTVVPVYFLNLVRNALVVYLTGIYGHDFFPTAHNIIGKGGSLVALIILLVIVIKVIPEVFDEILSLTDLYKEDGPLEQSFRKIWRKK